MASEPDVEEVALAQRDEPLSERLDADRAGLEEIRQGDRFGAALAELGDLDGDGIPELLVGAPGDDEAWEDAGALWLVFLGPGGAAKRTAKITPRAAGIDPPSTAFGHAVAALPSLDADGERGVAVAQSLSGEPAVEVWTLRVAADGRVTARARIAAETLFPVGLHPECDRVVLTSRRDDAEGWLAVGLPDRDRGPRTDRSGIVQVLEIPAWGAERFAFAVHPTHFQANVQRIGRSIALEPPLEGEAYPGPIVGGTMDGHGVVGLPFFGMPRRIFDGGPERDPGFGSSLALLGDLDGDGTTVLAVGERTGPDAPGGGIWLLHLDPERDVVGSRALDPGERGLPDDLRPGDRFGASLCALRDLDRDGRDELAVGAPGDSAVTGAVYVISIGLGP